MSTIYNPNGTVPAATAGYGAEQAIVSSTDASPIVLDVTAHGYNTGDTVDVDGHVTNFTANGTWTITVIDANHFALNGSSGAGGGPGSGGRVIDYSVPPLIQLPSDADLVDASGINPALQGLANVTPYMYQRLGFRRVRRHQGAVGNKTLPSTEYPIETIAVGGTWQTAATPAQTPINPGRPNDVLDASLTTTVSVGGLGTAIAFAIGFGIGNVSAPTLTVVPSSMLYVPIVQGFARISLRAYMQITVGDPWSWSAGLMAWGDTAAGTWALVGAYQLVVDQLRFN